MELGEIGGRGETKTETATTSVTRWLDYLPLFGYLQQLKFAQKLTKFAKVGSKLS